MNFTNKSIIQATCEHGLAPWLSKELSALGYLPEREHKTGVELTGTLTDCLRLNLYSRVAYSIQYQLSDFTCQTADDLYRQASQIAWEEIIPLDGYFTVVSNVFNDSIRDTRFPNLRLKDAVVDRMIKKCGRRPNSGNAREGVVIQLNWHKDRAWLFLNTSGRKLSDRGYRKMPHTAPLRESLAAAILDACGYNGSTALVNPMCGSGTLAIEAALLAKGIVSGAVRDDFAIKQYPGFPQKEYQRLREEAQSLQKKPPFPAILATDHAPEAIEAARQNARDAGVEDMIEFSLCDFAQTVLPPQPGQIILNPEYGERLGEIPQLEQDYKRIGDWLKQSCKGWRGGIFTGNLALAKKIGLRADVKTDFFNGKIPCRLLQYSLY